jgi:hypothetical protein
MVEFWGAGWLCLNLLDCFFANFVQTYLFRGFCPFLAAAVAAVIVPLLMGLVTVATNIIIRWLHSCGWIALLLRHSMHTSLPMLLMPMLPHAGSWVRCAGWVMMT